MLHYILFEKIHRYYFDYCVALPKKKISEKKKKFVIKLYRFLHPFFYKFRYKLSLYFPNKYLRYEPKNLSKLMNYEVEKYYNSFDKLILKLRLKK